jgi:hypothetical protein
MQTQPQQTPAPEQEHPQAWSKPHIWKISGGDQTEQKGEENQLEITTPFHMHFEGPS